jgi:hypothetical protein
MLENINWSLFVIVGLAVLYSGIAVCIGMEIKERQQNKILARGISPEDMDVPNGAFNVTVKAYVRKGKITNVENVRGSTKIIEKPQEQ